MTPDEVGMIMTCTDNVLITCNTVVMLALLRLSSVCCLPSNVLNEWRITVGLHCKSSFNFRTHYSLICKTNSSLQKEEAWCRLFYNTESGNSHTSVQQSNIGNASSPSIQFFHNHAQFLFPTNYQKLHELDICLSFQLFKIFATSNEVGWFAISCYRCEFRENGRVHHHVSLLEQQMRYT